MHATYFTKSLRKAFGVLSKHKFLHNHFSKFLLNHFFKIPSCMIFVKLLVTTIVLSSVLSGCSKVVVYPWHDSTMGIASSNRASFSKMRAIKIKGEKRRVTVIRNERETYGVAAGVDQVKEQNLRYVLLAPVSNRSKANIGSFDLARAVELPLTDASVLQNILERFLAKDSREISLQHGQFVNFSNTLEPDIRRTSKTSVRENPQLKVSCSLLNSFKACRLILSGDNWYRRYLLQGHYQIELFARLLATSIATSPN